MVIGNSFSAAQFEMYTILSEEGLGSVTLTSSWGASPVPEIPKANAYYWDTVVLKTGLQRLSRELQGKQSTLSARRPYPSFAMQSARRTTRGGNGLISGVCRLVTCTPRSTRLRAGSR